MHTKIQNQEVETALKMKPKVRMLAPRFKISMFPVGRAGFEAEKAIAAMKGPIGKLTMLGNASVLSSSVIHVFSASSHQLMTLKLAPNREMRCMVVVSRVLDFTWAQMLQISVGQNDNVKKKHDGIADFQLEAPAELLVFEPRTTSGAGKASFFFASKVCHMCYHHALGDMNNLLTVIQSCNALHSPSWMRIVVDIRSDPLPDATFHHTVAKSAGVVAKQAGKTQAC